MKTTFLFAIAALLISAGSALAASNDHQVVGVQVFTNMSTSKTSDPINVGNYRNKSLHVTGIAVSGHTATSLSGTLAVQCAPTYAGNYVAQTANWTTSAGAALSTTSNTIINWTDACQWMKLVWTKTSGEVSAWLGVGN